MRYIAGFGLWIAKFYLRSSRLDFVKFEELKSGEFSRHLPLSCQENCKNLNEEMNFLPFKFYVKSFVKNSFSHSQCRNLREGDFDE